MGPKNWIVISSKIDLLLKDGKQFDESNEIQGDLVNEVLKKGCPINIDKFNEGDCTNSIYNGISITIDFISNNPKKVRILGLRSFGESLHHSITDGSLEFGYQSN